MDEDELIALKYRQLQKIAKAKGLKANLQKDALIKGILKCQEENGDKIKSVLLKPVSQKPNRRFFKAEVAVFLA